jgi:putative DNA methylase
MKYKKKLIEVALPLEAINAESAREKSIRHGHPSTLHLWWARRPLAAARAVIWSSLVDDPSSHPEEFPTEEEQNKERQRLFGILERLVKWKNSNNEEVLNEAKAEIMKSTNGNLPALLDPFAGGGSIPLEAQRLGLEAHASDLNPVAVMINKAMIEIPPKFAGHPPVNPESRRQLGGEWKGAQGLAEDVRYYGEWMKQKAWERIGHLYPKVKDEYGQEHTVIAWIWARTVKCPNPACGCEMPLVRSFALSKKKGNEFHFVPQNKQTGIYYEVRSGKPRIDGTVNRKGAKCFFCDTPVGFPYIRDEGKAKRINNRLVGIVAEGSNGRVFLTPTEEQFSASQVAKPIDYPDADLPNNPRDFKTPNYGMSSFADLFTNRQLVALTTFSDLVSEVHAQVLNDGGSDEYADAISVYLGFVVDKLSNYCSSNNGWSGEFIIQVFGRQAIPMVWDFAETNVFSNSTGCFSNMLEQLTNCIDRLPASTNSVAQQHDAQTDNGLRNVMVSTDPPYYDNIGYADLSDYFYLWMRRTLKEIYPDLFRTVLVPKSEELVATPYRFEGSSERAKTFFENGMFKTFCQIFEYATDDVPLTVYYAFKQSETEEENTASTGWETMLSAIIHAGFLITGTWPMHTERETGLKDSVNALASSIILVCRKRHADAPICTRRDFINTLKRELKPALQKLQASNIAPVDLAQSAIGPGMGVYSRFSKVLEADGKPMSVRSALQIINQELDLYFTEQDGELDRDSRFCVDLYTQYAFNDVKFGEADVLARAKNTSVEKLAARSVLYAQKGVVRLLTREELPKKIEHKECIMWLLTQQLTRALEKDGVLGAAKIVSGIFTSEPEQAKALAYRLFQVAERKGWAQEAYAYNSLVIAWPEVQSKAAELQAQMRNATQITLFDTTND